MAGCGIDGDRTAHDFGQGAGDRQAKAGAAIFAVDRGVGLDELVENAVDFVGGDADTAVGDADDDRVHAVIRRFSADAQTDEALVGKLDGVTAQIDDDLAQACRITGMSAPSDRRGVAGEIQPFRTRRHGHHRNDFLHQLRQAEGDAFQFDRARLDLGDIKQVVDQGQQAVGAGLKCADELLLARRQGFRTGQDRRQSDDGVHRGTDLVRHIGQEFGLGDIGGFGGVAGVHQRFVRLALLRTVARDDDIAA